MISNLPPSARERIGGRWAISLRGYAVLCVLLVVGTALADVTALGSGVARGGAPLSVVAQWLLMGAVLVLAHLTLFRNRSVRPVPIWAVAVLGGVVALARPACVMAIRAAQGQPSVDGLVLRSTGITMVLGVILLPALAYVFATRAWYSGERARLIARGVQVEAERLRASGAIETAREVLRGTVNQHLDASRASASAMRARGEMDAEFIADLLMHTARDSVRPLSHGLWVAPRQDYPSMSWRQVAVFEARRNPLPILVPSVGFVLISTPLIVATSGWAGALVLAVVALASIGVVFRVGRRLIRARPALTVPVVVGAVLAAPLPITALGAAWFSISAAAFAPAVVLLLLLLIAGGIPAAASDIASDTIADLEAMVVEREVAQLALNQEHARIRRELAAHLHGTLQPRLVNASHAVREAARGGDAERLEAAMRDAETALALADHAPAIGPCSLAQVVDTAQRDWSRLLVLTWDVRAEEPWSASVAAVAEILRESLANAVVHGQATVADVGMIRDGDDLVVTIIDNGIGPQHGERGLGAEVLNVATARRWTLQPHDSGGSVVTAAIRAYEEIPTLDEL
jgi:signal transduction histidine kinase